MTPPDDFNPDVDGEIKRGRCLELAWFDLVMPARCVREWGHGGGHLAAGQSGFAGPTWVDGSDEMGDVA